MNRPASPQEGTPGLEDLVAIHRWLAQYQVGQPSFQAQATGIIPGYDEGGIYDPLDQAVPGDHYGATHFALLSSLLYRATGEQNYLEQAQAAIDFHLRTCRDEYKPGDWDYHWDFNNYALLETYQVLADFLPHTEKARWLEAARQWKNNTHEVTNWLAMRAYAYLMRSRLTRNRHDEFLYAQNLKKVLRAQAKDGCFEDVPGRSRPIQYHLFTMALLHRIYRLYPDELLRHRFLEGLAYWEPFIDPDGCFNYQGRGQQQIFGYACALYVLEAARQLDPAQTDRYRELQARLWAYLLPYQRPDGHWPLVLNEYDDAERIGWYDYHHLTVYEAFFGAWLGLAYQLSDERLSLRSSREAKPRRLWRRQMVTLRNEFFFLTVSAGQPGLGYLSDCGLAPHHLWVRGWGPLVSCPGGISPEKYGTRSPTEYAELNFWAPLAVDLSGNWLTPANKPGQIVWAESRQAQVRLNYGPFAVERWISLESSTLSVKDRIVRLPKTNLQKLRLFNFPILFNKGEIRTEDHFVVLFREGRKLRLIVQFGGQRYPLTPGPEFRTAAGLVTVFSLECQSVTLPAEDLNIEMFLECLG